MARRLTTLKLYPWSFVPTQAFLTPSRLSTSCAKTSNFSCGTGTRVGYHHNPCWQPTNIGCQARHCSALPGATSTATRSCSNACHVMTQRAIGRCRTTSMRMTRAGRTAPPFSTCAFPAMVGALPGAQLTWPGVECGGDAHPRHTATWPTRCTLHVTKPSAVVVCGVAWCTRACHQGVPQARASAQATGMEDCRGHSAGDHPTTYPAGPGALGPHVVGVYVLCQQAQVRGQPAAARA